MMQQKESLTDQTCREVVRSPSGCETTCQNVQAKDEMEAWPKPTA